ncbi:leucine-rich repeat flightless-interacting protein 1 isoform X1 [Gavia stellata]|uniref:leucine-rich repeat flightless-interacting protein 1 isoform X1 n=1 Tax=Gavia stellata TaxID=37040 RepID=UPI00289E6511|nr:leucine-rich repeat flightless-interacting protein 1 isoform X1 [Gavia stellata]
MGTQGAGRKRLPNRERLTAEDDALNQIAREAEARLAAKRAARAEAREIRMKELERQQKEIYQVQKKYYGLDTKWGDIEQWMEDSERYSRRARRNASASDEDERMSVGSRGSLRSHLEYASTYPVAGLENERTKKKNYSKATNGYEEDVYGSSQSRKSSRASYYSDLGLHNSSYASTSQPSSQNGNWPSLLYSDALPARSYRASVYDESVYSGSRRYSASSSRAPSDYSCYLGSGSRASSRASSARASPVIEERPEKDFEKGARTVSSLSAATLASLGGTSSRRGSGDTSISADTEASIREIKDIYELKDQIQDVEGKYMQGLKEMKDSLAEVEEKYKKAMVSNAQLDNEKTNFMYQVDTLKDALLELEEQLAESRRQYEEKSKEFEREKHAHSILQFQFMEIKEALKQREEMLAEIQQLQQKQQSYVREISDLQETIEWKDKKIGALERQKDFFDSIRSERDDLRDEVVVLKEQLKKHGIIPDSDVATNGETSDILDNEGHLDSSKTVPGTTQALKTGGDGTLGKANEVDMKNEILEDVGKREILQNTEREEHKEESEEQEVQTLHADENAKAEKMVEEHDALSRVMLPDSRFTEQIQSLTEHVSGSASSNDDSDADDLREETESAGTAVQQPVSTEAEHHGLNARTDQNSEVGSLQGHQVFETPQEMPSVLGTEHELENAAPKQEEREDLKTGHARSDNEMDQEADITSESCELVSNRAGLPEVTVAGSLGEEVNVESHAEGLQHLEESAENKVTNVLKEKLVESKDCTDERIDKTGDDRAEEEKEVGNTVLGQTREIESVGLEGRESRESSVPAGTSEKEEGGDQARIQPVSSEDSPSASSEEQNMQGKTELENATAEKDGEMEVLMEELEMCSDSAEAGEQDKASVEAVGCITEGKGSVLQQAETDTDIVKEVMAQETSLDPSLLDDKIKESELETGDESGKRGESRTEWVEDLKPKVEVQTVQCSEETTGDTVGEKNTSLEGEAQNVVKQEEGESKEESTVNVSVTTENKVDKETLKENEQELELADHHDGGFASEEGANNSLAQKAEQDEDVSEQVKLEGQAEERLEDDGDAFDFDEESKQILETDEKCDGEKADTQKGEGDGGNGAVGKPAQTDKAGERTDKTETEDTLTEDDSLQHEKEDEPEETGCLQGEATWKTDEKSDVMEDEIKASDSNKVEKKPDENVSQQDLESAGNHRDESKEDLQGGRRGKGKSRDDCTVS